MPAVPTAVKAICGTVTFFLALFWCQSLQAQPKASTPVLIVEIEGGAEVSRSGSQTWEPASVQSPHNVLRPGDQLRTRARSRAAVRLSDQTVVRLGPNTVLRVLPQQERRTALSLVRGLLYLFHRDKPGEFFIQTPTASPVIRGTEFNLEVAEDGTTTLHMFEGAVEIMNQFGSAHLGSGQAAIVRPGAAPARIAALPAANVIQWCLYYPGILDLDELQLGPDEQNELAESLAFYRLGDLLHALEDYPLERQPASDEEKIYFAALLLAVGQVSDAQKVLGSLVSAVGTRPQLLAAALRKLIAAVRFQDDNAPLAPDLATTSLAESYYEQSHGNLQDALSAASKAVSRSPNFGFASTRVAELEFGFGRTRRALKHLTRSLETSPRNAQAMTLMGFVLAAQNRIADAGSQFDEAIGVDPAFGNAWLGRGLLRIHQGQMEAGIDDLQMAVILEPQRALLRSYLAKAYYEARQDGRAQIELGLAKTLDPADPTSWFYSALFNHQKNRINDAIADLRKSQRLNDNRRIYRSRLLLDQDRAVRGANLARVYKDSGLSDMSLREAVQAVNADYGNYSAHLFLANSYAELSDPSLVNLRYETPRVNEYLMATLLAPVGAGILSGPVSQHEYGRLFERNHPGLFSSTEYRSRGDWIQSAAQYGTVDNFSYSLEGFYRSQNGQQSNNDLLQKSLSVQSKYQATAEDSFYFQTLYAETEGGDLRQVFNPETDISRTFRFEEQLDPIILGGYHREWHPGIHTLVLGGRLRGELDVENESILLPRFRVAGDGTIADVQRSLEADLAHTGESTIYHAEVQQLVQLQGHSVIAGGRYQKGEFSSRSDLQNLRFSADDQPLGTFASNPPQMVRADLERLSFYLYDNWELIEPLRLTAGISYDQLRYPNNFRFAPISEGESSTDAISPKLGLIWKPFQRTALRAAYTKGLGGVSFDQSFRLEPTQVAGFNQAWRSIVPESITGANSAEEFETWGVALDQGFPSRTYVGLTVEWLNSEVKRGVGVYRSFFIPPPNYFQSTTLERLDYSERTVTFALNQLIGNSWAVGAHYRNSKTELKDTFPEIPSAATVGPDFHRSQRLEALLHHVNVFAIYNHPLGLFGRVEGHWYKQDNRNRAESTPVPAEDSAFWQFHAFAGYRFARRKAELTVGVLNIGDHDARLHPLSQLAELPRDRTFVAKVVLNF